MSIYIGDIEFPESAELGITPFSRTDYYFLDMLRKEMGKSPHEVNNGFLQKDPTQITGFFTTNHLDLVTADTLKGAPHGCWKRHGRGMGWAIHSIVGADRSFEGWKRTFEYHMAIDPPNNLRKTNWIMNVYFLIDEEFAVETGLFLCHVFQGNGYNPRPKCVPHRPHKAQKINPAVVESHMAQLKALFEDPETPAGHENHNPNSGGPSTEVFSSGTKRNRADAWDWFTAVKAHGPDGALLVTLAICNHCCMAYRSGSKNGTTTLENHKCGCSCNH